MHGSTTEHYKNYSHHTTRTSIKQKQKLIYRLELTTEKKYERKIVDPITTISGFEKPNSIFRNINMKFLYFIIIITVRTKSQVKQYTTQDNEIGANEERNKN